MKKQIKSALTKLKEYGWELCCALPKVDVDDYYELDFKRTYHSMVFFVILNGITLSFANMEAVERDCGDLAYVQLSPDELTLFLDICNAAKGLSDEDMFHIILEGARSL